MDDPQDDEKRQRPGEQVACENRRKNEERDQVERLARERVEQITRKGTDRQGGYRIAGERDADHRVARVEHFGEVKRQYRHQQVKAEVEQEVGCQDTTVARCDEAVLGHGRIGIGRCKVSGF